MIEEARGGVISPPPDDWWMDLGETFSFYGWHELGDSGSKLD